MTQVIINDILPLTQAIAVGAQTVYSTTWTANVESDVVVYSRPANTAADDATQMLNSSQYSVAFIGGSRIVQVTLVTPSTAGDLVTITRQTPADRENLYTNTNFTPSMLNNDFGILTLVDQQAQLVNQQVGPRYNYSEFLTVPVDTILPQLGPGESWVMNASRTAITAAVAGGSAADILAELASHSPGEGASLIGLNPTGTVQDLANAPFILKTVNAAAPNAQALAALSSGVLKSATVTGVVSISAPLTSIDGLTTVADKMIYTTASNVYATTDLTPVARALLAQTTFAGMAVVLGALPLTGGTMSGAIDMGNQQITDMADPTSSQDAVTLSYLNTALGLKLSLSGGTMTGQINMGSHFITNLLDPVNPQDAATRNYVDSVATGFAIQPAVFAATTPSDVYTVIYNNGASGIGATLTNAGALVAFPIDSLTPGATNRVLIKDQAAALQNGIYTITNAGSGAVAWILTRATDYDQPSEIQPGDLVVVNNGTVNAGTSWIETASVSSIGVDAIDFSQFTFSATAVLLKVNNLSDVANLTTAFNNISPSTTKGDLIANNGTDDVRLAVGGSNGQILQVNSAAATGLSYSTATYPVTTTINQILYSSATNTITGISSLAGGVLVTDSSSVPQFLTNPTAVGRVLLSGNSAIPTWSTASFPATAGTTGNVLTSDGTNWGSAPPVVASLLTTKGDLFGFSTVEARFPVATGNGKILQVDSTATFGISYSTATYPVTAGTAGNFLKSDGTNWTSAAGTSGTVTSVATAGLASGGTITTTGTITVTAAVKSDQTTSTSTSVAVVPGVQQYHPSATKAWAQWAGASGTIASSYNVSSVTHNSTGNFTVNFTVSFADTNYCASGSHSASGGSTSSFAIGTTFNVGSAQCRTFANGAAVDATLTCATFSGNQ